MKLLRVNIAGLKIFNGDFNFNLVTDQNTRTDNKDSVERLFNRVYVNNILTIIGKNASGKTNELELLDFVLRVFMNNEPINSVNSRYALIGHRFDITTYYYAKKDHHKYIYKLDSSIERDKDKLYFTKEDVFYKRVTPYTTKHNIFNDINARPKRMLTREMDNAIFPIDNTYFRRITIGEYKKTLKPILNFSAFNNVNMMPEIHDSLKSPVITDIIKLLDPSIDYIQSSAGNNSKTSSVIPGPFTIKFKDSKPKVVKSIDIYKYLSSGTIKGLSLFSYIYKTLSCGGYLLVDELENHFHHALVMDVINMFSDKYLNPNHATLIFTTHYPELWDTFSRNDGVYISRRSKFKINLLRASKKFNRTDWNCSEIYKSDILGGTVPSGKAWDDLSSDIESRITKEGQNR